MFFPIPPLYKEGQKDATTQDHNRILVVPSASLNQTPTITRATPLVWTLNSLPASAIQQSNNVEQLKGNLPLHIK